LKIGDGIRVRRTRAALYGLLETGTRATRSPLEVLYPSYRDLTLRLVQLHSATPSQCSDQRHYGSGTANRQCSSTPLLASVAVFNIFTTTFLDLAIKRTIFDLSEQIIAVAGFKEVHIHDKAKKGSPRRTDT
jgi:hypothetical protein